MRAEGRGKRERRDRGAGINLKRVLGIQIQVGDAFASLSNLIIRPLQVVVQTSAGLDTQKPDQQRFMFELHASRARHIATSDHKKERAKDNHIILAAGALLLLSLLLRHRFRFPYTRALDLL